MAKKVTIDNLDQAIKEILDEYEHHVQTDLDDVTHKVALQGARTLRAASKAAFGGTGKYASGWKATVDKKTRFGNTEVIHNAKVPGLPHLLENGHASRNGGRVAPNGVSYLLLSKSLLNSQDP